VARAGLRALAGSHRARLEVLHTVPVEVLEERRIVPEEDLGVARHNALVEEVDRSLAEEL